MHWAINQLLSADLSNKTPGQDIDALSILLTITATRLFNHCLHESHWFAHFQMYHILLFPQKWKLAMVLTRRVIAKNASAGWRLFWLQNHDNLIISGMMGLGWAIPSRVVHHCWTRGQFGAENQVWRRWNGQPVILVIIVIIIVVIIWNGSSYQSSSLSVSSVCSSSLSLSS